MKSLPTKSDLLELERVYLAAKSDVGKIEWKGHYPNYPETIEVFFCYITSSVWCNRNYDPIQISKLIAEISSASILDLKSILTAVSRNERFCTGAWKATLERDQLNSVLARAKEIIKT